MASINTGTVTVDFKFRPRPRAGVMVAGRIKMGGHDALVRPQDLELRTIKSIVVAPASYSGALLGSYVGYKTTLVEAHIGSIGVLDTSRAVGTPTGNYARLRASQVGSSGATWGGTALPSGGSVTVPFLAFGE